MLSPINEQLYSILSTMRQLSLSGEPATDLQRIFRPQIQQLVDKGASLAAIHPATGLPVFTTVFTEPSFVDFVLQFPNVRIATLNMTPFVDAPGPVLTKLAAHGLDVNRMRNGLSLLGFVCKMSTDNNAQTSHDLQEQVSALIGAGADPRQTQSDPQFENRRELFDTLVRTKRIEKHKLIGRPQKTS